ncbi:MAG: phosphoenolpyruvate synthase [Candidatus Parvarchaeota archaeon]|nr:phosphoenolpyruvate synthase [Candidatus Jingweiarchaeum tengchongense]MCW1298092.1 phosphoenolpyruvate synthase [Candidatus Jingweiarchaeum tengchongense]MCW1300792.1 phosphoenolpyruvate synthase [Candidatus Jingweiarchaeum tengchongense]MCW1304926.1 phosphoenolpyruvate synthase [Candidatus Jingweiarchaeum tengchongense]MCW1305514.1 phosphoenolpyruvate synthase [Candidatus Jingweiarchaeum tengchongense]
MVLDSKYIYWFNELRKENVKEAGGKGANLGEMLNAGFPIPPGFVVSAQAYYDFLQESGIKDEIYEILSKLDVNDSKALQKASDDIQTIIKTALMPEKIREEIKFAYESLGFGGPERYRILSAKALNILKIGKEFPFVAVRSSATAEDLPSASFAGQQITLLNVRGADEVVNAVQECWASLFTPRAIFYRVQNKFDHMKVLIAVVVQKMVNSEKSGVAFSCNPATSELDKIVIEAGFGLGESIVSGEINPDLYIVDKNTLQIISKEVKTQEIMRTRDPVTGKTVKIEVNEKKKNVQKLSDEEIVALARVIKKIDEHYQFPQDIEWAIEEGRIYIVQSRPVTTLKKVEEKVSMEKIEKELILTGLGASPGIASGIVKILSGPEELDKVKEGDVLVTRMTNPDYVPAMRRASAIVTDEGGMTCHAAIVSREMGIPCVVGTGNATQVLKEGEGITVDGKEGKVYRGMIEIKKEEKPIPIITHEIKTATKIYMNLGVPEKIDDYKDLPFEGIGLMRIEFIIASYIGEHPNYLLEIGQEQKYIDRLAEGIAKVASAINPRPVVVRFSDFKTNEYRSLKGGEKYEPQEDNPMIGWRGVSRYISPEFEKAFRLECKAIKKVRDEMNLKNVWVMLPFVRTLWEVEKCLEIMKSEGLERKEDFQVWLMAEVPSIIFMADEFSKLCDAFSIGSNDLTQLIMGADRDSAILGKMEYFDERNEAVKRAISILIEKAHANNRTVSICGQAPSVYPEFCEFLIRAGIDSISVNPDVVVQTRELVAEAERKFLRELKYKYKNNSF